MADKNLQISLRVTLAGVKEVEERLQQLQQKLQKINETFFEKKSSIEDAKFKVQFDKIKTAEIEDLKVNKLKILSSNVKEADLQAQTPTISGSDTSQNGQDLGWKTAIQFSKMKAMTPAALMQMVSRITTLEAAFSGFIGVLGGIGMRVAFTTVTKYTRTVSSAMGELKNVILSLTGMDKMFSVQGITNSMIALADVTKEIQKQSLQTGIAVDALSQYRFAMKQVGVSAENFGSNISYMGKAIVQAATGASIDAGNAFKRLKLDPKELRLKDTQTQFEEIAKAIAQLPSETDKASAALLIFNRSGSQLLPFINKFSEGLKQSEGVLGQLPRLIRIYSSEFTQFSNNISNLQIKGQQYIAGFMTQVVPLLNEYLQKNLKFDFTDFGKAFADNFKRTSSSLVIGEDWTGLLNSFVLDLMDVVDKALVKTTEYIGDALIALDWTKITEKILIGTGHFSVKLFEKAWDFTKGAFTGENLQNRQNATSAKEEDYKTFLSKQGITDERIQDAYIENVYVKTGQQRYIEDWLNHSRDSNLLKKLQKVSDNQFTKDEYLFHGVKLKNNLVRNQPERNKEVQSLLAPYIIDSNKLGNYKKDFLDIKDHFENKGYIPLQDSLYLERLLKAKNEDGTYKYTKNGINVEDIIRELRAIVKSDNPGVEHEIIQGEFVSIQKNRQKLEEILAKYEQIVGKENASDLREKLLKNGNGKEFWDNEFLKKAIEEATVKLGDVTKKNDAERNDASTKLTGAIKDLKDATERLNKEQRDRELENSAYQKSPIHSDTQKAGRASVFIEDSKENLKELLAAYKKEEEVLNETKNVLGTDEEWVSQWDTVTKKIEELTQKVKALEAEGSIARDNETIKNINLQTEKANKEIEQLKNNLAKLKSRPVSGIADVKAVGEAQKEYVSKLTEEKTNTELNIIRYKAHGFDEDSEVVKKATERLEKFNTALEQATTEAEQWAQSVIVEGVQETVTQRNTELGQFEFEQLPEWAATNKQRYDYQMQVFDAQIQASEDNIEAIRKAQEQMLELDPAVQAVRKAMNELSRDTEDYDEKFAGLLNDLEQARSNSNVRRSAGYRQLEQMRGQEQTKGMMAQSRKQKQENPESFGHQMSKSISNASDQMGTLQENVGQGFGNMIMSVRDSLSTLVSDLLSGTMTIGQAFQKMGQMILQSLISTFGQIVANFVMQQTVMRLLQLMFNAELAAQAAALTTMWTTPATLASIASWGGAAAIGSSAVISALALTKSATAGMSAMAKGGRIKGKEQIIRVNEEGEEFIVSAKSPLANEKYLKLANLGYNLDSLFANQSMKEVNASASKLNIINNNKTERPQTNNNINIGMINSRQDKRRWMRKEGQRMIVDFLNGHRGALKYA